MSGNLIAIIVILVLLLVLAGIIYYAYCNIRKKLRDTFRMLFGTDSMIEGMKQREKERNIKEAKYEKRHSNRQKQLSSINGSNCCTQKINSIWMKSATWKKMPTYRTTRKRFLF